MTLEAVGCEMEGTLAVVDSSSESFRCLMEDGVGAVVVFSKSCTLQAQINVLLVLPSGYL